LKVIYDAESVEQFRARGGQMQKLEPRGVPRKYYRPKHQRIREEALMESEEQLKKMQNR
jgi:hypothetical protein